MDFEQVLALYRDGRIEDAVRACELILQDDPSHTAALIQLGSLRLVQNDAAGAEDLLRQAIAVAPDSADAHANLAALLQRQDRFDEAATFYERALALDPTLWDARFAFAVSLQMSGRSDAALTCYEALLQAQPAHAEASYGLGLLLAQLGRTTEAIGRLRAAVTADPDFAEANYELGRMTAADHAEEAITCFERALDVDPNYIEARLALGKMLYNADRDEEAIAAFCAVLAIEPEHPDANFCLAALLDRDRRYLEAIEHYRRVLAHNPEHADAMTGLASSLRRAHMHDDALAVARRVVELRPDLPVAATVLGRILAEMGALEEAVAEARRAVTLAPGRPEILYDLVQLAKVRRDDDIIPQLEAALSRIGSFSKRDQTLLHFALAKAYTDAGAPSRGFAHTVSANAMVRSDLVYEEAFTLGYMDRIRDVFTTELIQSRGGQGDPSTVPIFIVGMPRSGTTLAEQILASHSSVFGAGESPELHLLLLQTSAARLGATMFPEAVWSMPSTQFRELGAAYLSSLRQLAPDAARITSKMPRDFQYLGMIRLMLPNARIIHMMRDPVDTCLSCFSIFFSDTQQAFSYDLAELGRYYSAYRKLMAHWRAILPPGAMLEVQYEDLVNNFAEQARRIVTYCGLDWEPACLDFHKTSRPVTTASVTQVRQPLYRSSVGRWQPDASVLQPLLQPLADGDAGFFCEATKQASRFACG